MTALVVLALVAVLGCAAARLLGRWAVKTLAPAHAVITLCLIALAAALAAGAALTSIAVAYLATWPPVADQEHISTTAMRSLAPVPAWTGLTCAVIVVALLARAVWRTAAIGFAVRRSHRTARLLPGDGPVVFVDDTDVYTAAGLPGRIVVGTALFDRLDPADRQVVLAHEHSHLRHRHHLYLHAIDIATAANPFLGPLRSHVRFGIERWADEDAARSVDDRAAAAHALARTALTRAALRRRAATAAPSGALAAATLQVTTRVQALLRPAAPARTARLVLLALAALAVLSVGVANLAHVHGLVESAELHLRRR